MKPTKEQIEEALKFAHEISVQAGQTKPDRLYTYDALDILAAAYCSALARAELAERQYRELSGHRYGDIESIASMEARHELERKELEA